MNNKIFMGVVGAVLLAAIGAGGAFVGGVAYGRGQGETAPVVTTPDLPSPSGTQAQFEGGQANPDALAQLRARLQSGDATPEDLQQLRRQFAGQAGGFGGAGGGSFRFGGGRLNGTIDSIEGDTITVNTAQGTLQVTLSQDTAINRIVEVEAGVLEPDTRIAVNGQRNEAGVIEATSITITPEGAEFGGNRRGFLGGLGGQAPQTGP